MGNGQKLPQNISPLLQVSAVSAVVNWGTSPKAFVFRNYNHKPGALSRYSGASGCQMWQAVRASSAAPGYFQEFPLQSDIHQVNWRWCWWCDDVLFSQKLKKSRGFFFVVLPVGFRMEGSFWTTPVPWPSTRAVCCGPSSPSSACSPSARAATTTLRNLPPRRPASGPKSATSSAAPPTPKASTHSWTTCWPQTCTSASTRGWAPWSPWTRVGLRLWTSCRKTLRTTWRETGPKLPGCVWCWGQSAQPSAERRTGWVRRPGKWSRHGCEENGWAGATCLYERGSAAKRIRARGGKNILQDRFLFWCWIFVNTVKVKLRDVNVLLWL